MRPSHLPAAPVLTVLTLTTSVPQSYQPSTCLQTVCKMQWQQAANVNALASSSHRLHTSTNVPTPPTLIFSPPSYSIQSSASTCPPTFRSIPSLPCTLLAVTSTPSSTLASPPSFSLNLSPRLQNPRASS